MFIVIGDFDMMDGPTGQYAWIKTLDWKGIEDWERSQRRLYFYDSDDLDKEGKQVKKIGAYTKEYRNMKFAIVQAAGHLVSKTQLAVTRDLFEDMIRGKGL